MLGDGASPGVRKERAVLVKCRRRVRHQASPLELRRDELERLLLLSIDRDPPERARLGKMLLQRSRPPRAPGGTLGLQEEVETKCRQPPLRTMSKPACGPAVPRQYGPMKRRSEPVKAELDTLRTQGYTASGYIRALLEQDLKARREAKIRPVLKRAK